MYEVGVVAQFEAAHRLDGDFGPASRMHGHTYRVEITIKGEQLSKEGTLFDIGRLRQAVAAAVNRLDYQDLGGVDGLSDGNTTAEVVARYLFEEIRSRLVDDLPAALAVRLWESPNVFAGYEASLG